MDWWCVRRGCGECRARQRCTLFLGCLCVEGMGDILPGAYKGVVCYMYAEDVYCYGDVV